MSYITRTSSIVMVDTTCLTEALNRINASVSINNASKLSITLEGKHWQLTRLSNGTYSWRGNPAYGQQANIMFNKIGNAYQAIIKERQEAERREKERIANLESQLKKLNENVSFDGVKHKEVEFDKSKLEKELAQSQANLASIEQKTSELEKSKQHYLSVTKDQVEEKAKSGEWGLTALNDDTQKRQTRIQLRRRVKN